MNNTTPLRPTGPKKIIAGAIAVLATTAGCVPGPDAVPTTGIPGSSCPESIAKLTDNRAATSELALMVDVTDSFIGSQPAFEAVHRQVVEVVADAVEQNAALKVSVFTGTVATVRDVVVCPTMAARVNNEAAREVKTRYLKQKAGEAVWEQVANNRPGAGPAGSSIVGGWRALAESQPLAAGQRQAIMLSDGDGTLEDLPVDLSGFAGVGMFSVGVLATKPKKTADTVKLTERWHSWLTKHGGNRVVVTTQAYR